MWCTVYPENGQNWPKFASKIRRRPICNATQRQSSCHGLGVGWKSSLFSVLICYTFKRLVVFLDPHRIREQGWEHRISPLLRGYISHQQPFIVRCVEEKFGCRKLVGVLVAVLKRPRFCSVSYGLIYCKQQKHSSLALYGKVYIIVSQCKQRESLYAACQQQMSMEEH